MQDVGRYNNKGCVLIKLVPSGAAERGRDFQRARTNLYFSTGSLVVIKHQCKFISFSWAAPRGTEREKSYWPQNKEHTKPKYSNAQ